MEPIKLALNPFEPNHKKIGDLQMMVHAPLTKATVKQESYPRINDLLVDEEHPGSKIRRVLVSFMTPGTDEFEFDLDGKASHELTVKNKRYHITLRDIGEEEIAGFAAQKFLYFIFYVDTK
ncbi:hypothetical protein [Adhaeribacter aquaticus]|uniref:hypothetical protein n=1 Tax=Adhaeribacter aquaticus TaxID=299567 RepID=UPI00042786D0|nr:hypothetical protein [Adhaeribacter aquaticus]